MRFCQKCFDKIAARWAKKAGYSPGHILDPKKMTFPCQVPLHEPDPWTGRAMIRIWDCDKNRFMTYDAKEYVKMRQRGELK